MSSDRWNQLFDLIQGSHGRFHDLEIDHLHRTEIVADTPDGLVFRIERHPHVLGRRSKGKKSSLFRRVEVIYRFDGQEVTVVESKCLGIEWDIDLLVDEELDFLNESDLIGRLAASRPEPTREAWKTCCGGHSISPSTKTDFSNWGSSANTRRFGPTSFRGSSTPATLRS